MMRLLQRLHALLLCVAAGLVSPFAAAHEMSMAEMDVREVAPGVFFWQWTASGSRPAAEELTPLWPDACVASSGRLDCGEEGLRGTLEVEGVGERYSAAMVRVHWLDGQSRVFTLTSAQPRVQLFGSAEDRRGMGEIAWAYLVLGVEHILGGVDHLLFVLSLLFLVGFRRQLVWTITAFTIAHSITLVLSVLDLITLRSPPVEATIALSIVLVAGEALHRKQTFARRWPALVAFLFGLVHGLGFAGALKDIGLPEVHLPVALLTFNVGVELGQLAVVALAYFAMRALARLPHLQVARTAALYGIGSVAAFWSVQRILQIVS